MGLIDDIGNAVKGAVTTVVNGGIAVVQASVQVVTAPTQILVDAVTGKPVDVIVKHINEVVVDAVTAATAAANVPNFFVVDLVKVVAGEDAARVVMAAVASNVVQTSLPDILVKYLNKPDIKPEDIATLPIDVLLAALLQSASDQLAAVAKPVPDLIKLVLKSYFASDILEGAKYVVGKVGINLPEAINGIQSFMGNKSHAVTVPGVIVFSVEPEQSKQSLHWWAHELQHIAQYGKLGVAGFASEYVRNYQGLEEEAEQKANSIPL